MKNVARGKVLAGVGAAAIVLAICLVAGTRSWGDSPNTSLPPPEISGTPSATATVATPGPSSQTAAASSDAPIPEGFPRSSTTGARGQLTRVGPGGLLSGPGWTFDSRGWVSAAQGARLENLDIPFNLDVVGDDVVIRNSRITLGGDAFGVSIRHARNTLIEDSTITWDGKTRLLCAVKDMYGDSTGTVIRRVDINGAGTGVQIEDGLVEDSYIHDPLFQEGDHINGTTSNGGSGPLVIRGNTILNPFAQTDAVSFFQDFSVQANRVVEDNYLAGGGYVIYGGVGAKGQTRNIKIRNNQISTRYFPRGGFYGPVTYFAAGDRGNQWSDNTWADGPSKGKAIALR